MKEERCQGLNKGLVQEGNKPQETIKEVTPVSLQTRSCLHQTDSIRIEKDKGDNGHSDARRSEEGAVLLGHAVVGDAPVPAAVGVVRLRVPSLG